jgi:adenylate cyclase
VLNIELKARCDDLERLRTACVSLGAEAEEPERQIDTHFAVAQGRLKLRESLRSGAELIHYVRPDVAGVRESHYEIVQIDDAEGLKALLKRALGVQAVVAKRREVYLIGNVRVHLDKVQGLGGFVELEGIVDHPAELFHVAEEVRRLEQALKIDRPSLVKESYADLVAKAGTVPASVNDPATRR